MLWPDGELQRCYSPSSVIRVYFTTGEELPIEVLVDRASRALRHASDRVREKYGSPCGRALAQLEELTRKASSFEPGAMVRIVQVE